MDFGGDGYNDLVFPFQNAATGHWNQTVFYFALGSDVVVGRSDSTHAFAVNLQSTDRVPLFATFDVDGNGKDDVVCGTTQKGQLLSMHHSATCRRNEIKPHSSKVYSITGCKQRH